MRRAIVARTDVKVAIKNFQSLYEILPWLRFLVDDPHRIVLQRPSRHGEVGDEKKYYTQLSHRYIRLRERSRIIKRAGESARDSVRLKGSGS